ncbi:MAG: hypothetical protein K6E78_00385 [Treponema sp.]|nr:hypothetical protein [Treponema sp.]
MEYRYFPGRLRFRDHILRDEEIRNAAISVVKKICPLAEITYTEKTSGILATYPENLLDVEKLKPLVPLILEIEPKVRFYTPSKKQIILEGIKKIEDKVAEITRD